MKYVATSMASIAGCNETEDLNEVTGISRVLLAFLLIAFLVCVSVLYFIPAPMARAHGEHGDAAPPIVLSLSVFTLINLYMLNQPMGMRHGM